MPLAVTIRHKGVKGDKRTHRGTFRLGVYATGGIAYTARDFGLNRLDQLRISETVMQSTTVSVANLRHVVVVPTAAGAQSGVIAAFQETAGTLAEIANASTPTFDVEFVAEGT